MTFKPMFLKMLEDVIKFTWKKVEQTKPYRDEIENSN